MYFVWVVKTCANTIITKGPPLTQGLYGVFRSAVFAGGDYRLDMHPEPVASSIVQAVATEDGAWLRQPFPRRRAHEDNCARSRGRRTERVADCRKRREMAATR